MNSTLVNINKTTKKLKEAGVLFIGMLFGHVVIQLVTTVTNSSAHTARVGQRAGEVDVLHVLAQVPAPSAQLAAERAPVLASAVRALLNIGIQALLTICK